ncbi:choice-of-anchor B family protein [Lewinella sp. W8]|uniref:choice-of-anchor B family protein n=1 Tax=Lewinella sp. W8 TaxID=2528208 RepID=UPI001067E3E9|nr:choice-of-anchor B family protein [Lewinella sp. W8]MTB51047.1 choice-of-anchor B family protein [Lewinella sp. W8]
MRNTLFLLALCASFTVNAQFNTTLRSNLPYNTGVNDIWGYVAPDGTEYAIVGLETGVSFVSLADPDNPVEVDRIPGDFSPWRDMKTFGEYAYVVADRGDEGLTVIDLSALPDSVSFTHNQYDVPGFNRTFVRAHNIYIDVPSGRAFVSGGDRNLNDGGILIFDLVANPAQPPLIGVGPETYSHDVFVQDSFMYCSEIYDGELAIYNISDLDNITEAGTTLTPFTFTHNAWTTADGLSVFTTDEEPNAPVAAYDISDPSDIKLIDEYRPLATLNRGVIPHNVHVLDEYLVISYYTDGVIIVDASEPDNLIEVGQYDTWDGPDGDFNGCWGAYPFLPSGLVLGSDRQTGLYVLDAVYQRAARLAGTIIDRDLRTPLNNVQVDIQASQLNTGATDPLGRYKTGLAEGGTYDVIFTADNYLPLTVSVDLTNGMTTTLDTSLQTTVPRFNVNVTVVDDETGEPIPNANLLYFNEEERYDVLTNEEGQAAINNVFEGDYELFITEWGYRTIGVENAAPSALGNQVYRLSRGYMDDFVTDEGWTETATARTGLWERGVPVGTSFDSRAFQPGVDAPRDFGRQAYLTGNGAADASTDDIDGGTVTLTSPLFDLTRVREPSISYQYWFAVAGGTPPLDDTMRVLLDNGTDRAELAFYTEWSTEWAADTFVVSDYLEPTATMQLIVIAGDTGEGHLVEAGFDNFAVNGSVIPVSTEAVFAPEVAVAVFPNPSPGAFSLQYDLPFSTAESTLRLTNVSGQIVQERELSGKNGSLEVGLDLPAGLYFAEILDGNRRLWVGKVVKQ